MSAAAAEFAAARELLTRALAAFDSSGLPRERLAAASAICAGLSSEAAVPAEIVGEVEDFQRRMASPDMSAEVADHIAGSERQRILEWLRDVESVASGGAVANSGPGEGRIRETSCRGRRAAPARPGAVL